MPVNYSFNLYYRVEDLGRALLEAAKIAEPSQHRIDVTLPDSKIIQLPFTSDFKTDPVEIKCTGYNETNHTYFDIGLQFPNNPDVREYQKALAERSKYRFDLDDFGVGTIYLSVFCGQRYVDLTYKACCTDMSYLFLESKGVQERFVELARASGALGGVLYLEEMDGYRSLFDPDHKISLALFTVDENGDQGADWNYMIDVDTHVPTVLEEIAKAHQNL